MHSIEEQASASAHALPDQASDAPEPARWCHAMTLQISHQSKQEMAR